MTQHNPTSVSSKTEPNGPWFRVSLVREAILVYGVVGLRLKTSIKQNNANCGEGDYCVQVYSRRASLINEFCLDKQANNIADMKSAEDLLLQTMAPCDFASTAVTLIGGEGTNDGSSSKIAP